MTDILQNQGTGWIVDPTDERDKVKLLDTSMSLPTSVDLREWCSPIEDQAQINSCTAHAAITLVEYFEKRASQTYLDTSRLFLYKVARNLLHCQEDKGANARTTMKALAIFGVPPEEYWPYDLTKLYEEPSAFCYALAKEYKAHEYYRIDAQGITRDVVLQQIKANLAANRPLMFGFFPHKNSLDQSMTTGKIPVPSDADTKWSGHTVAAVGYDDKITIKNTEPTGIESTGAILIKNSWGTTWGDSGYGWLPYEYILRPLSNDWWTILKQDWLDTGEFDAKQ